MNSRQCAWRGVGVLELRLQQCRLVAEERRPRPFFAQRAQAGLVDCDLPCDAVLRRRRRGEPVDGQPAPDVPPPDA